MPKESGTARTWGYRAELAAAKKYGLTRVGKRWYDARYPNGTPVQIKACRWRLSNGSKGQFRFWLADHKRVLAAQGGYIGVIYTPTATRPIRKIEKVSPTRVSELATWGPSGHRRKGTQAKIRWDRLM